MAIPSIREFRIGNIVLGAFNNEVKYLTVLDLQSIGLGQLEVKGIPLSPEIMENCGFEHKTSVHKEGHIDWTWEYDTVEFSEDYELMVTDATAGTAYRVGQPLKYLHQLQNLYYFLMLTELETTF